MNKICKGHEPLAWLKFRKTPGVQFRAIPELQQALLQEQGHLCAYCMRRIPVQGCVGERMRVEYIKPRRYEKLVFAYKNLVACCPGTISGTAANEVHCDRKKDETEISFSVFSAAFINTISYSSKDGAIKSSNERYDDEINNILGLNNPRLAACRLQALEGVIEELNKKNWTGGEVKRLLLDWQSAHMDGEKRQFKEYNGIVVWFLKRKLMQMTSRHE